MTREEVLDAVYDEITANDTCVEDAVVSLLEEIVRLRGIISDMDKSQWGKIEPRDAFEVTWDIKSEAIAQLNHAQAVLSALREPSEAMVKAVDAALVHAPTRADVFRELIRRAVEAAEQEVNP